MKADHFLVKRTRMYFVSMVSANLLLFAALCLWEKHYRSPLGLGVYGSGKLCNDTFCSCCVRSSFSVQSQTWSFPLRCHLSLAHAQSISGPGSSVGIVTVYGMDGPGIETTQRLLVTVDVGGINVRIHSLKLCRKSLIEVLPFCVPVIQLSRVPYECVTVTSSSPKNWIGKRLPPVWWVVFSENSVT
jgi:hypothetical protein